MHLSDSIMILVTCPTCRRVLILFLVLIEIVNNPPLINYYGLGL